MDNYRNREPDKKRLSDKRRLSFVLPNSFSSNLESGYSNLMGLNLTDYEMVRLFRHFGLTQERDSTRLPLDKVRDGDEGASIKLLEALVSKLERFTAIDVMQPKDVENALELSHADMSYLILCKEIFLNGVYPNKKVAAHMVGEFNEAAYLLNKQDPERPYLVVQDNYLFFRKTAAGKQLDIRVMELCSATEADRRYRIAVQRRKEQEIMWQQEVKRIAEEETKKSLGSQGMSPAINPSRTY